MTNSKRIAGLLGPTLIALSITEAMNLDIWAAAAGPAFAPVVYLNGTLLFIAGLSIVRAHNRWTGRWPVLVTLVGWVALLFGLIRMIAPASAQRAGENPTALYALLIVLLVIGIFLTFKGFGRADS